MSSLEAPVVQVIDGAGNFNAQDLRQFATDNGLAGQKQNYQIVAIMGPQSSGKSTLLNHVFGTSFVMMDAMSGRSQTTKGIWMARSPKINEPFTFVMDLEGSDGRERGEDDTNFERQSALFALSIADVLLVNIWCHDIGREQGSGKPLLKTIFQVNLKLFSPEPDRRKTVLLFVLRDKTKTPLPRLVETMEADLIKMWESISKPAQYKESQINDFFEIQYAGLPHFEEKYEDFLADSVVLRRRFTVDADDSLYRSGDKLPGDAFTFSAGSIWEVIKSQKDLNLPAHKVMVANVRCAEIKEDQLRNLLSDQAWKALEASAGSGEVVSGFGKIAHGLVDSCVRGYEEEAMYFDPRVRDEVLQDLQSKVQSLLQPLYQKQVSTLGSLRLRDMQQKIKLGSMSSAASAEGFADLTLRLKTETIATFKDSFEAHLRVPGMPWDGETELEAFTATVEEDISKLRSENIAAALSKAERQLGPLLSGPVISLLDTCPVGLWNRLNSACQQAAAAAEKIAAQFLVGYDLTEGEIQTLSYKLATLARSKLEGHVREAALTRMSRMKDKFTEMFTLDANKTPHMWTPRQDIPKLAREARLAAAHVIAQLAILRIVDPGMGAASQKQLSKAYESVEDSILHLAKADLHQKQQQEISHSSDAESEPTFVDIMSAAAWPGVEDDRVLLQPHDVRTSWREFLSNSNVSVQQALSAQQANKLASNRAPPLWAIVAILLLGWNEFISLLCSPLYLLLGLLIFLFGRTLYFELDVDGEMQKGSLPGVISLANKFVPATRAVMSKTLVSMQSFASHLPEHATRASKYLSQDEVQMTELNSNAPSHSSISEHSVNHTSGTHSGEGTAESSMRRRVAPQSRSVTQN
ncbi:hypothetical protein CEUSTIGMA_g366.t1 [Chlamydomonas eustigma]|uniref:Protein ROOT HAIR DEFECTIVE 3 homolog n=1 Tax=Chlamydomonas eustigma TaxID=1157962 RepID=A0A250WQ40_9CHLO|nr:hypothetical protein CEUSTIGMA_g366.t1 [Chlamydomonas eustigma]|eukprot:GAX72911.1 hypothetical protein CEUSTIGMA_g366.t1 [Chlamydomonas eustigma]